MKRIFPVLFFFSILSCTSESSTELEIRHFENESCENCPLVQISIPEARENTPLGKSINQSVQEEIIELLDFDQENNATDIEGAMQAFKMGFQNLQKEFPEEMTGWEARVDGSKSYEDTEILTLKLDTYIFTGGAHGYGASTYLNFDKEAAVEIGGAELLNDPEEFLKLAEAVFRKQYDIPEGTPINSTGFMFEENQFILPENLGLSVDGLVLHYNPYEAASYADGALILKIPMEKVRPYLKKGGKESF